MIKGPETAASAEKTFNIACATFCISAIVPDRTFDSLLGRHLLGKISLSML